MRESRKPAYDLAAARRLVRVGRVSMTMRSRRFVANHVEAPTMEAVRALFDAMGSDTFRKSVELAARPGTWADVYCGMQYEGMRWYVKFLIDDDGDAAVEIWSMNWDGAAH